MARPETKQTRSTRRRSRVRIRFLWNLLEFEGEGMIPVLGGFLIAFVLVAWFTAIQADSSRLADLDRLYEEIRTSKGKLDILVANAGILEKATLGEISEDMVDRLLSVNVRGTIFTVQQALPLLSDGASIVLTSWVVANKGLPGGSSVYAATKAAIRALARNWILDLKLRGIRVNVVSPGPIETPGLKGGAPSQVSADAYLAALSQHVPAGRVGSPDEIANVIAFLASDQASFITGADIQDDGGFAQI